MAKVINFEAPQQEGFFNVLVQENDMKLWIDVSVYEGEIQADWNKYIFFTNDENDRAIKKFQEDCDNFENFTSEATNFLEAIGVIQFVDETDKYICLNVEQTTELVKKQGLKTLTTY